MNKNILTQFIRTAGAAADAPSAAAAPVANLSVCWKFHSPIYVNRIPHDDVTQMANARKKQKNQRRKSSNKWTKYADSICGRKLTDWMTWLTSVWRLLLSGRRCHELILAWFASFFPYNQLFVVAGSDEWDRLKTSSEIIEEIIYEWKCCLHIDGVDTWLFWLSQRAFDVYFEHKLAYARTQFVFIAIPRESTTTTKTTKTYMINRTFSHVWHAQALTRCNTFVPFVFIKSSTDIDIDNILKCKVISLWDESKRLELRCGCVFYDRWLLMMRETKLICYRTDRYVASLTDEFDCHLKQHLNRLIDVKHIFHLVETKHVGCRPNTKKKMNIRIHSSVIFDVTRKTDAHIQ